MKKLFVTLIILSAYILFQKIDIKAETVIENNSIRMEEGIALNETSFPNELVRQILSDDVDQNGDNILQQSEIDKVRQLFISDDYEGYKGENYSVIDCSGLENFTNLKKLSLETRCVKKYGFKNFDKIYQLKKLEELEVIGDKRVKKWEFKNFPNLKKLYLTEISNVKIIRFGKNQNLKKIILHGVKGKTIDLSKVKNLERFNVLDSHLKNIKFGKNRKLTFIRMTCSQGISNKTIKKLNFSGLSNLKKITILGHKKLNEVKFGNNKKLRAIWILGSKNLKTLNVSNCKNLKTLFVDKKIKVIKKLEQKVKIL